MKTGEKKKEIRFKIHDLGRDLRNFSSWKSIKLIEEDLIFTIEDLCSKYPILPVKGDDDDEGWRPEKSDKEWWKKMIHGIKQTCLDLKVWAARRETEQGGSGRRFS